MSIYKIAYEEVTRNIYNFLIKEGLTMFAQHGDLDYISEVEELKERLKQNKTHDHYLYIKHIVKKAKKCELIRFRAI